MWKATLRSAFLWCLQTAGAVSGRGVDAVPVPNPWPQGQAVRTPSSAVNGRMYGRGQLGRTGTSGSRSEQPSSSHHRGFVPGSPGELSPSRETPPRGAGTVVPGTAPGGCRVPGEGMALGRGRRGSGGCGQVWGAGRAGRSPQQLVGSGGEVQVKPGQLAVIAAADDVVTCERELGVTGVTSEARGVRPAPQGPGSSLGTTRPTYLRGEWPCWTPTCSSS